MDFLTSLVALILGALLVYKIVWVDAVKYDRSIPGVLTLVLLGLGGLAAGWILIRATSSPSGRWSAGEFVGAILIMFSTLLVFNGALPEVAETIGKMARVAVTKNGENPPLLSVMKQTVGEVKDADGKVVTEGIEEHILDITRVNGANKVFVLVEILPPADPKKPAEFEDVPGKFTTQFTFVNDKDLHGKVWYQKGDVKSLATDF